MKRHLFICATILVMIIACKGKEKATASAANNMKELPGKQRAAKAAERVKSELDEALGKVGLMLGDPVFIRAFKEERVLELFVQNRATKQFQLFRSFPIVGASGTLGPKLRDGDGQVPEGFYFVPPAAMKPDSKYHLAFNIGYPNELDRSHDSTGDFIMVHGNRLSIGCLAMTDPKIEEIYTLCDAALHGGQAFFRVYLFPFRMTDARMNEAKGDPNYEFWQNLKIGYDKFERVHTPSNVTVVGGKYVFSNG